MMINFKTFSKICAKHSLVPADGGIFWTAYRPWGFGGVRLKLVNVKAGLANDLSVFRALVELV